jgi:hypothetical protein
MGPVFARFIDCAGLRFAGNFRRHWCAHFHPCLQRSKLRQQRGPALAQDVTLDAELGFIKD